MNHELRYILSIILTSYFLIQRAFILGVPVDCLTMEEAMTCVRAYLQGNSHHHVTTPNPEMIVAAQKDPVFRDILSRASLALPDGAGVVWAMRRRGFPQKERVTGTDFLMRFFADDTGTPAFFLGAGEDVAKRAATILYTKNQRTRIAGTFSGSPDVSADDDIVRRINDSGASILLVAFGAPAQEKWIARNLPKLSTIRVAIGVGGAFDFASGNVRRAPSLFRAFHVEWLWRLVLQPWRMKRILTATVVFPYLVLKYENMKH